MWHFKQNAGLVLRDGRNSAKFKLCSASSLQKSKWIGLRQFIVKDFFFWHNTPQWARANSFTRLPDHTQRRTTVGRTPLNEWLARNRDLYLTTHNTCNRQISMPPVGFEPTISAGERPQTYALDRAATGTGKENIFTSNSNYILFVSKI